MAKKSKSKIKKTTLENLAKKMAKGFKLTSENHEALARMVAEGFENTATKADIKRLDEKIDSVEKNLKQEIQGLRNSVNNYLKLSDRRYLELKEEQKILGSKQKVLAKYLKAVIQKFKVPLDLKELEAV